MQNFEQNPYLQDVTTFFNVSTALTLMQPYKPRGIAYDIGIQGCAYEGKIQTQKFESNKTVFLHFSA